MELSFVNRVGEGGPSRIGFQERWWIVGSRKSGSLGNLGCSYTRLISLYPPECNAGTRALEGVKNGREKREGKRYPIVNVRHGNNEEKVGGEGSVFLVSLSTSGSYVALRICNHRNSRDK